MNLFFADALRAIRPLRDCAVIVDLRGVLETRAVDEDLCLIWAGFDVGGFDALLLDAFVDLDELGREETRPFCAIIIDGTRRATTMRTVPNRLRTTNLLSDFGRSHYRAWIAARQ